MLQIFLNTLIIYYFILFMGGNKITVNLNRSVIILSLILYFFFTSYLNTELFLFLNVYYTNTQLLNHFLIHLFNTNWTNLYLLLLVVFIYIWFLTKNNFKTSFLFSCSSFLWYIIFIGVYCFQKNSSELYLFIFEKLLFFKNFIPDLNFLLLNNLVLLHPILTHILYSYFIYYSLCNYFILFIFYKNFAIKKYLLHFSVNLYFITINSLLKYILIGYLMILLGSIWAAQELIWNNWWSWDIIEIIAFSFFITLIFFLHNFKKIHTFTQNYNHSILSILFFILFYFFIRLDVSASLHSFNMFDAIEIYLYFFCTYYIYINFLILKKKFFFYCSILKLQKYIHRPIKFIYLNFFFRFLLVSLYLYCFVMWLNDNEGYIIKNELIWTYSLIYKYTIISVYFMYYLYLSKLNLLLILITVIILVLNLIFYYFFKKIIKMFSNKYILMHAIILMYIYYIIIDNFYNLVNYIYINNIEINFPIFINRKINLIYPNNKLDTISELLNNQIIFIKYNYNSSLLYKLNYITSDNFILSFWQEQAYNYYLVINYFNNFLKNIFYKENIIIIYSNKLSHYILISNIFGFIIFLITNVKKKIKILI